MDQKTVKANPTKAFFVRMITRDISLEDCILDLIDNSVDGAREMKQAGPPLLEEMADLSDFHIDIKLSDDSFEISDNCGGISLHDAAEYAFTFGRSDEQQTDKYSIGVYGIGMKRAVFKLGEDIDITSTYVDDEGHLQSFCVPINVPKWMKAKTPNWDFDLEDAKHLEKPGVKISVSKLLPGASSSFGSPAFIANLRRTIARDYAFIMQSGLTISLDGKPIEGWNIQLLQGPEVAPLRTATKRAGVDVGIIAGIAAVPPDSSDPDDTDTMEERSGWYIVCNGRIVLAADRTSTTGWGTEGWPKWHSQYTGFMGFLLFAAENAGKLPLTTTKRSVDVTSPHFMQARMKMRDISKVWTSYTNIRKHVLEEAKAQEQNSKACSILSVKPSKILKLPAIQRPKLPIKPANISYAVPVERVKKMADALGNINMSYRDVGIATFEYCFEDLVSED
jgi:hypothetical protein